MNNTSKRRAILLIFIAILALVIYVIANHPAVEILQHPKQGVAGIKIFTREQGIYEIKVEELIKLGLIRSSRDLDEIHLSNRGEQLELWIGEDGETVKFYAKKTDSAYSQDNIYWLTRENQINQVAQDPGLEAIDGSTGIDRKSPSLIDGLYLAKVRLEENETYQPQVEVGGDHWLWRTVSGGGSQSFQVSTSELGNGVGLIKIAVWSSTEADSTPDHHLRVAINGVIVVDETWEGRGLHFLQGEIETGVLREGGNEIVVEAPGDLEILADLYYVDWIEIAYPRLPVAISDRLEFIQPEKDLPIRGFSGLVSIYEINKNGQVVSVAASVIPEQYDYIVGRDYLVVGPQGHLKPGKMTSIDQLNQIKESYRGAEYLAIGPETLLEPLKPLLEFRASQGLSTLALPCEMIFDEFNAGFPEPVAIMNFIRYAHENWEIRPAYLLLVGDASYDPKSYLQVENANQLPAFFITTMYGGETASDVDFGQLNDDPWPDIAMGLMPARTQDQVRVLVEKTLIYGQSQNFSTSSLHLVAVADGQEKSFSRDAQSFLDLFPEDVSSELFAPEAGDKQAADRIRKYFETNMDILAYFGHGSVNMWGKDRLFTTEDVSKLNNNQHPAIVINMTCLTGLYTHPKLESLSEALLWRPNGGAVAVLAPSSLTLPADQNFLSEALVEVLMGDGELTLGQIHLEARRGIALDSDGAYDVMRTFMLFGDPALELHFRK